MLKTRTAAPSPEPPELLVPRRLTPRAVFRLLAFAEVVTWTLLIAGMILKYGLDAGDLPVRIGGSVHGFVFLAYALTALVVGLDQRWRARTTTLAVLTAVVPYATVPFERSVDGRGLLGEVWQTTTEDPAAQSWVRRTLRWMLTHPVMFLLSALAAVVVVMTVLLLLGPPGSWGS